MLSSIFVIKDEAEITQRRLIVNTQSCEVTASDVAKQCSNINLVEIYGITNFHSTDFIEYTCKVNVREKKRLSD